MSSINADVVFVVYIFILGGCKFLETFKLISLLKFFNYILKKEFNFYILNFLIKFQCNILI